MKISGTFKTQANDLNNRNLYEAMEINNTTVIGKLINPTNGQVRKNAKLKTFKLENVRFIEMTKDGQTRHLSSGKSCFSTKTTLEFYGLN